jgi:hypothetical protein
MAGLEAELEEALLILLVWPKELVVIEASGTCWLELVNDVEAVDVNSGNCSNAVVLANFSFIVFSGPC